MTVLQKMRKFSDFLKENTSSDGSAWDSYKEFCKEFGENFMSFPEFESRFISFHKGEKKDYDDSSETSMKSFFDLPVAIIGLFVKRLRPIDRILLRQVSPILHSVVDNQIPKLKSRLVVFGMTKDSCSIYFGTGTIELRRWEGGYQIEDYRNTQTIEVKDSDYKEGVLNAFLTIFGHPKSKIKVLDIRISDNVADWLSLLKGVSHHFGNSSRGIHVKKLVFQGDDVPPPTPLFPPFLSLLKPGTLRNLIVHRAEEIQRYPFEEIGETEQWWQARHVEIPFISFKPDDLKYFEHFRRFEIRLSSLTVTELVDFTKILANSPNFEKCVIRGYFQVTARDYATASNKQLQSRRAVREPIENSDEELELRFWICLPYDGNVIIQRKKRREVNKN